MIPLLLIRQSISARKFWKLCRATLIVGTKFINFGGAILYKTLLSTPGDAFPRIKSCGRLTACCTRVCFPCQVISQPEFVCVFSKSSQREHLNNFFLLLVFPCRFMAFLWAYLCNLTQPVLIFSDAFVENLILQKVSTERNLVSRIYKLLLASNFLFFFLLFALQTYIKCLQY